MQGPLDKQHWSEARPWLKGVETFFQRFSIPGNKWCYPIPRDLNCIFPGQKQTCPSSPSRPSSSSMFSIEWTGILYRIFFEKYSVVLSLKMTVLLKHEHHPPPAPAIWQNGTVKEYSGVNALNNFLIGHNALHFFPYSTQWIDDADLSFKTWNWPFKGFKTVIIGSTPAWRERSGDETKQKPKAKEKEKHNKT